MSGGGRRMCATSCVAIEHGACPMCLGGGHTFDEVLDRLGPCSGCGGSGTLGDVLARTCHRPDRLNLASPPES